MNTKIKYIQFLSILISILFLASGVEKTISQTKVLKPKIFKSKINLVIAGKSRTYYQLAPKEPTVLSVKGPGKLKIITRGQFNSSGNKTLDYTVFYRIDGEGKIKTDFKNVGLDKGVEYKDNPIGVVAFGENINIELPRGQHTIELWSGSENPKVITRSLLTPTKEKKIDWVSLSPLFPNEPVNLVTNEDVVSYYRFSSKKPLKIKITGPTSLRLLNRLENSYQMKGVINYRLQIKEDNVIKNTYMLNSIGSDVTTYKKKNGKIPGKANEIVINVPGGTHIYEIIPLDKDKDKVLAKILFPKQDVKLEE